MGHSSDLMKKLDRVSIFDRNSEFDGYCFETRSIHVGNYSGRSATPIYASVTGNDTYMRHGDPTRDNTAACIASLENAKYTLVTASGVSSIMLPLLSLLRHGDKVICHRDMYIWSYFFMREDMPRIFDTQAVMIDMTDLEAFELELRKGGTRMVCIETMANPMLNIVDIKAVCDLAHQYGALVLVDNTFASPYLCRPLDLGADISSESLTKYMNGHGDTLGGSISTNDHDIYYAIQRMNEALGCSISPFSSFLITRGLETLAVRMEKHCDNAEKIAAYLATKPFVTDLTYPGLESHPQYELAKKELKRFGGVIGFRVKATHEELFEKFIPALSLWKNWVSLGEPHSLIDPKEEDKTKGIPADYLRLAVGLEDAEDLIADMEKAFKVLFGDNL